jgi:hypothetical protein
VSGIARVLLALLAAYPAGDVISRYLSVHALRSAPGIPALVLLGALGAAGAWQRLRARSRPLAVAAAVALALAAVVIDGRFLSRYFGENNRRIEIYHGDQADLVEATKWLGPRLRDADQVFFTTIGTNEPWAITLVTLAHEPRRWFSEPRDMRVVGEWEVCVRYGANALHVPRTVGARLRAARCRRHAAARVVRRAPRRARSREPGLRRAPPRRPRRAVDLRAHHLNARRRDAHFTTTAFMIRAWLPWTRRTA